MLRTAYNLILDLHPGQFRRRFGMEMLNSFDDAVNLRQWIFLIADGLLSLVRQWFFRRDFRRPVAAQPGPQLAAFPPQFGMLEPYAPQGAVVLSGVGLAAMTFSLFTVLIGYGAHERRFIVGAHYPGPGVLPVARGSFEAAELNAEIKIPAEPEDPLQWIAGAYFRIIRVLAVLDADKNLALSPWEIFTAPAALRKLDIDQDGKLSAEELGFSLGPNSMPKERVERARLAFMRENPVLAALDADHDREISASEIADSFRSLKILDTNRDGRLTRDELIPDPQNVRAAMLFMDLDENGDGRISREEREARQESSLRSLLQSADGDHDGSVTRLELEIALRLRAEKERQLESAERASRVR